MIIKQYRFKYKKDQIVQDRIKVVHNMYIIVIFSLKMLKDRVCTGFGKLLKLKMPFPGPGKFWKRDDFL